MLGLAAAKTQTGRELEKPVLRTEGHVTLIEAYLAGGILIGLSLVVGRPTLRMRHRLLGIREGRRTLRET